MCGFCKEAAHIKGKPRESLAKFSGNVKNESQALVRLKFIPEVNV